MGVIKSSEIPVGMAAFSMTDIEAAARSILRRARAQQDEIISQANQEARLIKEKALAEGFVEGRKDGLARGMEEGKKTGHDQALTENNVALRTLIQTLTAAATKLDEERHDLESHGLREVIDLACALARRAAKRQGILDPQVLIENLKEAMSLAVRAADVRIAVHPSQREILQKELPSLRMAWPKLTHVELIDDATISPGGVRILTAHGTINGDLDAQLDRIISEMMPDGHGPKSRGPESRGPEASH